MITLEQAKEIWQGLNENNYSEQEINDKVDDYCCEATRYYETDEGKFTVIGIITHPDNFDADEVEFQGKDGECYSFPAYEKVKA